MRWVPTGKGSHPLVRPVDLHPLQAPLIEAAQRLREDGVRGNRTCPHRASPQPKVAYSPHRARASVLFPQGSVHPRNARASSNARPRRPPRRPRSTPCRTAGVGETGADARDIPTDVPTPPPPRVVHSRWSNTRGRGLGETATPASGPRPVRVRFFKSYRAPRVRSASSP
eukprot:gene17717-biopygen3882